MNIQRVLSPILLIEPLPMLKTHATKIMDILLHMDMVKVMYTH